MKKPNSTFRTKEERRESANLRKEERHKRSDEDQLKMLDKILGHGVGAVKERKRLLNNIEKKKKA